MTGMVLIKTVVSLCVLAAAIFMGWACRILNQGNSLSKSEVQMFVGTVLMYLLISAGCFIYFEYRM